MSLKYINVLRFIPGILEHYYCPTPHVMFPTPHVMKNSQAFDTTKVSVIIWTVWRGQPLLCSVTCQNLHCACAAIND